MKKLLVLSTLLILTANPTLAAGLRIYEFEPESGCGLFLSKPQQNVFNRVIFQSLYWNETKMIINDKLFDLKNNSNQNKKNVYKYTSRDGRVKVQIKIIKLGKDIVRSVADSDRARVSREIDKAILTVTKDGQTIEVSAKGRDGC